MRAKHGVVVIKPEIRPRNSKKITKIVAYARREYEMQNINEQELNMRYGIGRYGMGNIDLYNRPQFRNMDGSVSTVRSMSFNDGTGEILVPTIAFDDAGKPYAMSDAEAINRYYNTGEYLGKFKTVDAANEYASRLHRQQEHIYR